MAGKLGLWDGDSLVWRFGFVDIPGVAISQLKKFIKKCEREVDVTDSRFYLGTLDHDNFRYKIFPGYKGSRTKNTRPTNEAVVRNFLLSQPGGVLVKGAEADDAMGIVQCTSDVPTIIFSNDKDMDMIPGEHYDTDWHRIITYTGGHQIRKAYKKRQVYTITDPGFLSLRKIDSNGKPRTILCGGGQLWFCAQLLLGDSADDIPGLAKLSGTRLGPVGVYNLLKDCKTFENAIKLCYTVYKNLITDKESVEKHFTINCKLLWIKRAKGKEEIFPREWITGEAS